MPVFKRPDAELSYEVHGSGFPLLLQPGTDKPHPARGVYDALKA